MDINMFKQEIQKLEEENVFYETLFEQFASMKNDSKELNNKLIELMDQLKQD